MLLHVSGVHSTHGLRMLCVSGAPQPQLVVGLHLSTLVAVAHSDAIPFCALLGLQVTFATLMAERMRWSDYTCAPHLLQRLH